MKFRGVMLSLVVAGVAGLGSCTGSSHGPVGNNPSLLPAMPAFSEDAPIVAVYRADIDPLSASIELRPLLPNGELAADENEAAIAWYNYQGNYGGPFTGCSPGATCIPGSGQLRLYTDQTKAIFVDSNGICHGNSDTCNNRTPPCSYLNMYCAPIQMVSELSFAMPNVVLQVNNSTGSTNPITGCSDPGGLGLCSQSTGGSTKVDSSSSSLTSPILGGGKTNAGTTLLPCSWCYGNTSQLSASTFAGLRNAVMPSTGSSADQIMAGYNTDTLAMQLTNSGNLTVVVTVRYSTPAFSTGGTYGNFYISSSSACATTSHGTSLVQSCASPGNYVCVTGGSSFGPPGAVNNTTSGCFGAQPLSSCGANSAYAGPGYSMSLVPRANGSELATTINYWSDSELHGQIPTGLAGTGIEVKITTPAGTIVSSKTVELCGGQSNSWRTPGSAGYSATMQAMGGVLGSSVVMVGGRNDPSNASQAVATGYVFTPPSSGDLTITTSTNLNLLTPRWGAAYGVVNGSLYVVGGSDNTGGCLATTEMLSSTAGPWTSVAGSAPDSNVFCQATGVVLGNHLVVTDGLTRPDFAGTDTLATCVLDTSSNTWAGCFYTTPNYDVNGPRYNAGSASSGSVALILGGANADNGTVLSATSDVTQSGGVPTYVNDSGSGFSTLALPGVAYVSGKFYYSGGSSTSDGTTPVNALKVTSSTGPVSWSALATPPSARAGHLLIAANGKLYAIGGYGASGILESIDEYTP